MKSVVSTTEKSKIPDAINEVLKIYFERLEEKLPNVLESFYLFGSVSLGAYQDGMSDIDFYAVVKRKLTDADIDVLKQVHLEMKKEYPKPGLDGMYVTKEDLDGRNEGVQSCPYFNEGKLQMYRSFHRNWIDAYQLKTYGIVIKGLPIETYHIPEDWKQLKKNLVGNISSYWMNWTKRCESVTSLQFPGLFVSGSMIEWGVLGVTRLFYSIKEEGIISKVGAGEYALYTVPEKYHPILQEAIRIRKGNKKSLYRSIFKRRKDALDYMKYMIEECNSLI
ncbi:aminoglycoside adenylyltransferase domain-containing protein [Fictibacillus halophilus]|uniref:aminoglycoside adenylyltransferase domain-containing protein n=1 Tax=Fictibacillus halophilus TaxID=1610490 RepID=UPI001CFBFDB6|nr:aminoglycoside adenylyltransferase domain-containing protein [Fictibacillus halophilus]